MKTDTNNTAGSDCSGATCPADFVPGYYWSRRTDIPAAPWYIAELHDDGEGGLEFRYDDHDPVPFDGPIDSEWVGPLIPPNV